MKKIVSFLFVLMLLFSSCKVKPDYGKLDYTKLSTYDGKWDNISSYLDKDFLKENLSKKAEKRSMRAEDLKQSYNAKFFSLFKAVEIKDDEAIFYDKPVKDGGKVVEKAKYKFLFVKEQKITEKDEDNLKWNVYESDKKDGRFRYIMLLPLSDEHGVKTLVMRAGDNYENMLSSIVWEPTYVDENTSEDEIKKYFE